jgi:hypothetical protein
MSPMSGIADGRSRHLVAGMLLVLGIFVASAWALVALLTLMGWSPLEGRIYAYGIVAIAFVFGGLAVYGLFRWAKRP